MSYIENPKDPLHKATSAPHSGRELFKAFGKVASGFGIDDVASASANMLINAVRQKSPTRKQAQDFFDEVTTRARASLLQEHYNSMGKRRNVYPFHQKIEMPHFDARKR